MYVTYCMLPTDNIAQHSTAQHSPAQRSTAQRSTAQLSAAQKSAEQSNAVQHNSAQRNTTLGNLQLPSTRYIYEKQLIDALEKCIIDTDDPKLKEKLTNWRTEKTTHFPLVWVDLIQLSSEMKYALSTNSGFVGGNEQDGLSQTKESLNYLLNINQNELATSTQLEKHLHRLINSPLPAKLWLSQKVITKNLYNSTKWLQQHTRDLQCSGSRSKNNMKYMTNVFQQFFIEKIQPIASQINHYQYQLGPIFQNYSSNPHLSSSFKEYIKQFNQQGFENYQREMSNHIQFWQVLFKRCNIKPGKP